MMLQKVRGLLERGCCCVSKRIGHSFILDDGERSEVASLVGEWVAKGGFGC